MDKINQTVTDEIKKINTQVKDTQKTLTDKITGQEKTLTDKINQQVKDSQKTLQDKITAQDKTVKDANEKIGNKHHYSRTIINDTFLLAKLEKVEPSTPKSGGETAKLVTLTKAIDAIQENSKSLETMGMYHNQRQI